MKIILNEHGHIADDYYETEIVISKMCKLIDEHLSEMDCVEDMLLATHIICESIRETAAQWWTTEI